MLVYFISLTIVKYYMSNKFPTYTLREDTLIPCISFYLNYLSLLPYTLASTTISSLRARNLVPSIIYSIFFFNQLIYGTNEVFYHVILFFFF